MMNNTLRSNTFFYVKLCVYGIVKIFHYLYIVCMEIRSLSPKMKRSHKKEYVAQSWNIHEVFNTYIEHPNLPQIDFVDLNEFDEFDVEGDSDDAFELDFSMMVNNMTLDDGILFQNGEVNLLRPVTLGEHIFDLLNDDALDLSVSVLEDEDDYLFMPQGEDEKEFNRQKYFKHNQSNVRARIQNVWMNKRQKQYIKDKKNDAKEKRNQFFIDKAIKEGSYKCGKLRKSKYEAQSDSVFDFFFTCSAFFTSFFRDSSVSNMRFPSIDTSIFSGAFDSMTSFLVQRITFSLPIFQRMFILRCRNVEDVSFTEMCSLASKYWFEIFKYHVDRMCAFTRTTPMGLMELWVGYMLLIREQRTVKGVLLAMHQHICRDVLPDGMATLLLSTIQKIPNMFFPEPTMPIPQIEYLSAQGVWDSYVYVRDTYFNMKNQASCELIKQLTEMLVVLIKFDFLKNVKCKKLMEEIKGINISKMKMTSTSAFVVVIDALFHVVDRIWNAVSENNFNLLFVSSNKTFDLENKYAEMMSAYAAYKEDKLEEMHLTPYDVEAKFEDVLDRLSEQLKISSGHDRNYFSVKYQKTFQSFSEYLRDRNNATIRERPFGLLLFGDTGVGKSAVTSYLLKSLYDANNMQYSEDSVVSLNASDKYQSEYKSRHKSIIIDDIANVAPAFTGGVSPLQIIIDIINNQPKYALKPDVESKGKVAFRPKFVIGTTNVKSLQASIYSNNAASILSRFEYHITVKVKEEYRSANSSRIDPSKINNKADVQLFKVEQAVQRENSTLHEFIVVNDDGKDLVDIDLGTLMVFLAKKSKIFSQMQRKVVERTRKVDEEVMCIHHSLQHICPECLGAQDCECPSYSKLGYYGLQLMKHVPFKTIYYAAMFAKEINKFRLGRNKNIIQKIFMNPMIIYTIPMAINVLLMMFVQTRIACLIEVFNLVLILVMYLMFQFLDTSMVYYDCIVRDYLLLKQRINNKLCQRQYYKWYIISGVIVFLYLNRERIRKYFFPSTDQGAVESVPIKPYDYAAPDSMYYDDNEKGVTDVNIWKKPIFELPIIHCDTVNFDKLEDIAKNHLVFIKYLNVSTGKANRSNAFYVHSNLWLVPYHIVSQNYEQIQLIYHNHEVVGHNFSCRIGSSSYRRIGNSDGALLYLPQAQIRTSALKYFVDGDVSSKGGGAMYYRTDDAKIVGGRIFLKDTMFTQTYPKIKYSSRKAVEYNWTQDTFAGLCGGIVLSESRPPYIYGIHVAGVSGRPEGVGQLITQFELSETINKFKQDETFMPTCSQGILKLEVPEKEIYLTDTIRDRSPTLFMDSTAQLNYYGPHTGPLRTFVSNVEPTFISRYVHDIMGIPSNHGPPKNIKNWRPWQAELAKLTHLKSVCPDILKKAAIDLNNENMRFCDVMGNKLKLIKKISNDVNLAGLDGESGFEAINLKASMGWPTCKPKSEIITRSSRIVDGISCPLDAPAWLWDEVDELEMTLSKGVRVNLVHRCNLKDEPTKLGKEKVRVFAGTPVAGLLLVRRYYLPLCKLIMDNPIHFECAVGINCYSKRWTTLTNAMLKYGNDRVIAGDYKDYDSSMPSQLTMCAMKMLVNIAKRCGYSSRDITIMEGIATEICYPLYEFNGDFIQVNGSNPSGHSLTVFLNNIVNSLYLRYAYYDISSELKISPPPFKQVCSVVCYGDDNKMSVKKGYDWYNHTAIANSLGKCNIVYTMAEKEAESVPFIKNEECSFLKRKSIWSDKYKRYLCPIEIATLHKILHSHNASKELTPRAHSVDAIRNVLRECFFHGREIFAKYEKGLQEVAEAAGLLYYFDNQKVPTFDEVEYWYLSSYVPELCVTKVPTWNVAKLPLIPQGEMWEKNISIGYRHQSVRVIGVMLSVFDDDSLLSTSYLGLSPPQTVVLGIMDPNMTYFSIANKFTTVMGSTAQETVNFHDGNVQIENTIAANADDTYYLSVTNENSLQNFFKRPILVNTYEWNVADGIATTFNPWTAFFSNEKVYNRLSNFNIMHCALCVKFIINGNPFYYGRLMVDYHPLHLQDTSTYYSTSDLNAIVSASQRLHLLINPTTSQAGVLKLPYLLNTNHAYISTDNIDQNGIIHIRTLQDLKHANGSTQSLNISVYVYCDYINVSIPTASDAYYAQGDEYTDTNVSQIASAVASASGKLNALPMIGPYARATQLSASAIAQVARLFGFARPPNIDATSYYKPELMSNLVNTNVKDNVTKLAFDVKQELSIDTRTMGLDGEDEMLLKKLATKESYLTQFTWSMENVTEDILFASRVRPQLTPFSSTDTFYLPACAFVALPFKFWRGTMRFRFEFVCSAYHRGRVLIIYDPQAVSSSQANIVMTRVMDLSDQQDVTIDVSWASNVPFLNTRNLTTTDPGFRTTAYTTPSQEQSNGVIEIRVLNQLTTPSAGVLNDISVNVYVSMGEDAEFAVPNESNIRDLSYPSNVYVAQGDSTDMVDDVILPVVTQTFDSFNDSTEVTDHTYDVFFGEKVVSFRSLLKRYNLHSSWADTTKKTESRYHTMTFSDFPLFRGLYSTGVHTGSLGSANFVHMTLLNYVTPAYLMFRGGLRSKYSINNTNNSLNYRAYITRGLYNNVKFAISDVDVDIADDSNHAIAAMEGTTSLFNGAHLTPFSHQPVLEVELPFYMNRRFLCAKDVLMDASDSYYRLDHGTHTLNVLVGTNATPIFERYISVAEDFTLGLFQGAPPISNAKIT